MNTTIQKIIDYAKKCPNQEKLLDYLRELDFVLLTYEALIKIFESEPEADLIKKLKHYSFAIRKMREFNLYDGTLFFAFKMYGKKVNRIHYFVAGENKAIKIRIPWKDHEDINFKKMEITLAFPIWLDYVERRKWRTEYHRHKKFSGKYPYSIFYLEFYDKIMELSKGLLANKKVE